MKYLSDKTIAMFDGLGINPDDIIKLNDTEVDQDSYLSAISPFPTLSRYRKYIAFMDRYTSFPFSIVPENNLPAAISPA